MVAVRKLARLELERPAGRLRPWLRLPIWLALCTMIQLLAAVARAQPDPSDDSQYFDRQIAPMIARRCLSCHSGAEPKGKLDLSSSTSASSGGESGPALDAIMPQESLIWQYILTDEMPPKKPLNADEKETFRAWFENGAKWGAERIDVMQFSSEHRAGQDWWSLQPLKPVVPPQIEQRGWSENPIDTFVLTRLHQAGLVPSVEADKRTLIRRVTFDLLGLPPTPTEIDAFLADTSQDAYEHLVTRLLDSSHYGERWARHWLDVVRFGESNGFEYDEPRDNFWHYRNWVIHALNRDMPYDQFAQLQLAGDVMHPDDMEALAAVGFLVAGPHNTTLPSNQLMRMSMAQDELEDLVGTVGQTFLGLTANCARCHDHKFDPISQREYYQLAATLAGVQHGEKTVRVALTSEQQNRLAEVELRIGAVQLALEQLEAPLRQAILAERKQGDASTQVAPKAFATWELLSVVATDLEAERDALTQAESQTLYTCMSRDPGVTHVLLRGNVGTPGEVVSPSGLSAVAGPTFNFGLTEDANDAKRRLRLAHWITDHDNPLFSRVMVNRVWQYHFGQGMVATSSDFGFNGGLPSHPELLDWLANWFRDAGFRLKPLHRLIVTSSTYRQSSELNASAALVDADNRWLWRKSPLRLEAEEIRDAVLVATGGLMAEIGGRGYRDVQHVKFKGSHFYEALDESGPEARRRTIYRFTPRGGRNTFLDIFDCPDPSTAAPQRASTTTPLQALALMNNSLMFERADEFARRVEQQATPDMPARINLIYEIAYSRAANLDEVQLARQFVESHGLASFCRVIFNSNEFLYVR